MLVTYSIYVPRSLSLSLALHVVIAIHKSREGECDLQSSSTPSTLEKTLHLFSQSNFLLFCVMEKHKCKLCARMFGSGRALGGHMRSHFTILPLPTKTQLLSETPSSSSDEKLHFVEDSEESEIELKSLHPLGSRRYRKRSGTELERLVKKKKKKKSLIEQPVSSEPETCSEEDLAMWLMLLSRDKWVIKEQPVQKSDKIFMQNGTGDVRIHECPVCYKVFKSGQALGGHKRSHLLNSTAASSSAAHSSTGNLWLIDLNLPAPLEDGQEISHTQIPVLC